MAALQLFQSLPIAGALGFCLHTSNRQGPPQVSFDVDCGTAGQRNGGKNARDCLTLTQSFLDRFLWSFCAAEVGRGKRRSQRYLCNLLLLLCVCSCPSMQLNAHNAVYQECPQCFACLCCIQALLHHCISCSNSTCRAYSTIALAFVT